MFIDTNAPAALVAMVALAAYFEEAAKAGLEVSLSAKQVANVLINRKPDLDKILPATLVKNIHASTQTVHMDEKELAKIIDEVLAENQKAKEDVKKGKVNAVMFLVGQVLRKVGTQADANRVKFLLEEKINV